MEKFINKMLKNKKIINYEHSYLDIDEYGLTEEESKLYITRYKNQTKKYEIGDIVYVPRFKYDNAYRGKNHLFVIVKENNCIPIEYFCMLISSNLTKLKYKDNLLLQKDDINNLNKDSIVKTDMLYRIKEDQISFYIGKVSKKIIMEYIERNKVYE